MLCFLVWINNNHLDFVDVDWSGGIAFDLIDYQPVKLSNAHNCGNGGGRILYFVRKCFSFKEFFG